AALFRQVIERLENTPGIEAVGSSNGLPLTEHGNAGFLKIEGRPRTTANDLSTLTTIHIVSSGYLRAFDVPLTRGRLLTADDTGATLPVAVINETAAKRFWNDADPIGKRLSIGRTEGQEVWRGDDRPLQRTHPPRLDEQTQPPGS